MTYSLRHFAVAAIAIVASCAVGVSQSPKPPSGLALIKPQTWSKPENSRVQEFVAIIDNTARDNKAVGYYILELPSGRSQQVDASRVTHIVQYTSEEALPDITKQEDVAPLSEKLRKLSSLISESPATRTYLSGSISTLTNALEKFSEGKIRFDGRWMDRNDYDKLIASKWFSAVKNSMLRVKLPEIYDLKGDKFYLSLVEMGKASADAHNLSEELESIHEGQITNRQALDLIKTLSKENLSLDAYLSLSQDLLALTPSDEEIKKQAELIRGWISLRKEITSKVDNLKKSMETWASDGANSDFQVEVVSQMSDVSAALETFQTEDCPAPLKLDSIRSMKELSAMQAVTKLPELKQRTDFFGMKVLIEQIPIGGLSATPSLNKYLADTAADCQKRIEDFLRFKADAETHAASGSVDLAIKAYEDALRQTHSIEVEEALEKLRKRAISSSE